MNLNIAIVGCGGISRAHVRSYERAGGASIVKVFDVFRTNAEKLAEATGAQIAESIAEIAEGGGIDAVSVCTPPGAHLEACEPLLKAGIPILCEKPFELNEARALELAELIRRYDSPFMIAFCQRFHPAVVEAKRLLTEEADLVGEPLFFRNFFGGLVDVTTGHRGNPAISGGGILIDNGCHSLDLYRLFMGEVESVGAQTLNMVQQAGVEDFASIEVRGVNGTAGQISGSYSLPVPYNTVEIFCSKSTLTLNYWLPERPDLVLQLQGQPPKAVELDNSKDRYTREVEYFLECVRTKTHPVPGVEDGLLSARMIEAAYRSAREGQRISL